MLFADLFSGAGGMSRGMSDAGFQKLFSVEIDADGSATIRRNFPDSHHFERPIEAVTEAEMSAVVGDRGLQMVCGGPPCQGFSVAGLRDPVDPRNQLFREYIRAIRHLQPDIIVMENVPGIITMDEGAVVREIRHQLADAGYPGATVRVLEAARYGVPQLRTRAIFVANRHGLKNPYPAPILARDEYVPIEAAIEDLKALPMDPAFNHNGTRHGRPMIERLSRLAPGASLYPSFRDAWKRQHKGVPSMAIKENHGGVHVHYELNRVLTAREMARLQTFPDDFFFEGRFKRVYWQIGNAVPCLFAEHLGRAVAMQLSAAGLTNS
jgi:DNA (cytosine-5)-methyltransferase 1